MGLKSPKFQEEKLNLETLKRQGVRKAQTLDENGYFVEQEFFDNSCFKANTVVLICHEFFTFVLDFECLLR